MIERVVSPALTVVGWIADRAILLTMPRKRVWRRAQPNRW